MAETFEGDFAPQENSQNLNVVSEREDEKERAEVKEEFKKVLTSEPSYLYHDGSAGCSHKEDLIELSWKSEREDGTLDMKLDVTGTESSNYAYSQEREFKSDSTVVQISKAVAQYGFPEEIGYTKINYDNWEGQDESIDERKSARFNYSELESDILVAARGLSPEYTNMSLQEIGTKLLEEESKEYHKMVVDKFRDILLKKPQYIYHDGSDVLYKKTDDITLFFGENDEHVRLDCAGSFSSNYAYSRREDYDADVTVLQLAKIIAKKGMPESISYSHTEVDDVPGHAYVNKKFGANIDFSEVHEDILNAARTLLSLEDIGKALTDKDRE